ncbi:hypothetical protein SELMODRAFT_412289 [Selaginella moellendorffii]|uniref:Uncharacterized protein n=1 Tax=Selaginella moellendorffii TaxID=88036 RepID=D8RKN6_SELML|nr:hypothetical protein SELMODRAFT_412289 [Selaginella moellendorffii]
MINNPTSQDFEETKLPPQHPSDLYKLEQDWNDSKGTSPTRNKDAAHGGERNGYCWMVSARERTTRLSMGYTSGTTTKSYVWFLTLKRIRVWNVVAVVGRSNVRLENAGPVKTRST